ncbi:Uncharacterized protein DAT39_010992 [Clarias magur]|uniref:Uncharacterized protein n=1 Tax=Clarias magur TaxID=1594786 RepID=A0A8J4WZH9_CLAMG|nr:Uncharacterized protein DAT39_010992 [Clarias magur]
MAGKGTRSEGAETEGVYEQMVGQIPEGVRGPTQRCRRLPREPGPGNGSAISARDLSDLSITPYLKQYGPLRSSLGICERAEAFHTASAPEKDLGFHL